MVTVETNQPRYFNKRGRATIERILEAGTAVFYERWSAGDPFSNVSVREVAERAGLQRNGLLYFFETKEALSLGLAKRLFDQQAVFEEDERACQDFVANSEGLSAADAVARLAMLELSQLDGSTPWRAMEHLTLAAGDSEELQSVAKRGYQQGDEILWNNEFGVFLGRIGRKPREPFSGGDIAMVVQALLEGAALRRVVDPTAFDASDRHGRTLFAHAVAAVLTFLTTAEDDVRDAAEVMDDLLGPMSD